MFKENDIIILTSVPGHREWENKKMKYSSKKHHILLDEIDDGYATHKIGAIAYFNDEHLKQYKAKLYIEKKNHLPRWW